MDEQKRCYVIICKDVCYGPFHCPKDAAEWAALRAQYSVGSGQFWASGEWVLREVVRADLY